MNRFEGRFWKTRGYRFYMLSMPIFMSEEAHTMPQNLAKDPSNINLEHILDSDQYYAYFDRFQMFQDSIRRAEMGKTAQFWLHYMDVINMILAWSKRPKRTI